MTMAAKKTEVAPMPDLDSLAQAAECLRALAHPMRLKILFLLESTAGRWGSWPRHAPFAVMLLLSTYA